MLSDCLRVVICKMESQTQLTIMRLHHSSWHSQNSKHIMQTSTVSDGPPGIQLCWQQLVMTIQSNFGGINQILIAQSNDRMIVHEPRQRAAYQISVVIVQNTLCKLEPSISRLFKQMPRSPLALASVVYAYFYACCCVNTQEIFYSSSTKSNLHCLVSRSTS